MGLDGESSGPRDRRSRRRSGVAMIYQELSLCPHLSVEENILLGMEPTVVGILRRSEIRRRAIDALSQLGYGDLPTNTRAGSLSVAMQQMVEIARAIAVR